MHRLTAAVSRAADTRLLVCIAIGQAIGWGTLFSVFPLFGAPMEAELGWTRTEINAGLTLALLVSGLAAVPVGQHVDRHGGRRILAWGAWLGAALLAAWACTTSLALYWGIWAVMGLAQAAALWGPAMAVVVATARDPNRTIAGITFVTGFTGTVFVPLGAALIAWLGWRDALLALAAMQVIPGLLALWLLPQPPPRAGRRARGGAAAGLPRPRRLLRRACLHRHRPRRPCHPAAARTRPAGSHRAAGGRAARALPGGGPAGAVLARPPRHHARRRPPGHRADALRHAGPGAGAARPRLAGALRAVLGGGGRADDHRPRRRHGGDPGAGGLWRHHRRAQRRHGAATHRRAGADRADLGRRRRLRAGALAADGARGAGGGGLPGSRGCEGDAVPLALPRPGAVGPLDVPGQRTTPQ
ncbi:hypothetical protein CKO45_19780 [Paracraurococcus ruber]|uniref:MFS transporter n=1 Tax=Paracraurococcus ruber TaxID=77675 RepID=A0ABS1D1T2_9PROT|nr:hypothetical protein [Paracraurococcus ruber]